MEYIKAEKIELEGDESDHVKQLIEVFNRLADFFNDPPKRLLNAEKDIQNESDS